MREQGHAPGAPGEISRRGVMREEAPRGEASRRLRLPRMRKPHLLQGARPCAQAAVHEVLPPVLRHRRDDDGGDPPPAQEMVRGHMAHVEPEGRHQRMRAAAPDRLQLQDIGADACAHPLRHGQIGVPSTSSLLTAWRRTASIWARGPEARGEGARSSSRCLPPSTGPMPGGDRAPSGARRTARETHGASSGTTTSAMHRG